MVELLFVMAIMIGLAAIMAASIGPVQANISRQRTKGLMKMLGTGLAQFQAEYGSYPKSDTVEMGANVLYKTMFGDYNEDGKPDWSMSNAEPDDSVKTFVADLNPGAVDPATGGTRSPFVRKSGATFILVDSWGTQLYYVAGPLSKHNETYDLWSLGNDPDPADENDSMWIKNW